MMRLRRERQWRPSPVTALTVSAALSLIANMATSTVHLNGRRWVIGVWATTGLLLLTALVIEWIRYRGDARTAVSVDVLGAVSDRLSGEVRNQWAHEAVLRRVRQPVPLRVRWSSTGRPVAAGRDVVLDQENTEWQQLPLEGDIEEIVEAFRALPHRQLVVLGKPGAGKSVLAMLLTLELIERPVPGQPSPVLLPIASWKPNAEHLELFLLRRLAEEYRFLAGDFADGRDLVRAMWDQQRILPILDGLDELPVTWRALAVEALDRFGASGRPFVVTCRSHEYEQAVLRSGSILSRAAVVEIEPLGVDQTISFLSHPAPSRGRWQPVFDHLRNEPDGTLAKEFSTPLTVSLARAAFRNPASDPRDLLQWARDDTLTESLVEHFIASIYEEDQPAPPGAKEAKLRRYTPAQATRWLSCLAHHLHISGMTDLWWWQLSPGLLTARPGRARRLTPAVGIFTPATIAAGLAAVAIGTEFAVPAFIAVAALVTAARAGVLHHLSPDEYFSSRARVHRTPRMRRRYAMRSRFVIGTALGMLVCVLVRGTEMALAAGVACGVIFVLIPDWRIPAEHRRSIPWSTMSANRRNITLAIIQYAVAGGVIFTAAGDSAAGISGAAKYGLTAAVLFGTAAGYGAGLWTWTHFRLVHVRLVAKGRLPLRLWAFLDDAHRRGVLRQAGTAWQFRHAVLQNYLADVTNLEHLRIISSVGDRSASMKLTDILLRHRSVDGLRTQADTGDWYASRMLADLLDTLNRDEDLRALADCGDRYAESLLADRIDRRRQIEHLRARFAAGHSHVCSHLADLLISLNRTEEALELLRPVARGGDLTAVLTLTDILVQAGRTAEAMELIRPHADADVPFATQKLVTLLALNGEVDELAARADSGDAYAKVGLIDVLAEQGRFEDLQALADAGDMYATSRLVDLLTEQGRFDELQVLADAGDPYAGARLTDMFAEQGRIDDLRARGYAGDAYATRRLTDVIAEQKRIGELRTNAYSGDIDALVRLAELPGESGRVEQAITMLRNRTDSTDASAVRRLVQLLVRSGRTDDAIALLQRRIDNGDGSALEPLVSLRARTGSITPFYGGPFPD